MTKSNKAKIQGLVTGILIAASMSALAAQNARGAIVKDNYHEVMIVEPYYVEVCGEQTSMAGDVVDGAIWGAIFGAVLGDVITEGDGGRLPGAIIGGAIGAKSEENKGVGGTTIVCKTEERKTRTKSKQYWYSTIYFEVQGQAYELDFKRNDR
tara:strand:- start:25 stop:483 length:459 start_codon:yes stop_codon:yes gene_type:complete